MAMVTILVIQFVIVTLFFSLGPAILEQATKEKAKRWGEKRKRKEPTTCNTLTSTFDNKNLDYLKPLMSFFPTKPLVKCPMTT